MRVPVLTYHALNMDTNEYVGNDHIALTEDLRVLHANGNRVVPLAHVVDWRLGLVADGEMHKAVAITLDDGTWFDYYDLEHPKLGMQRSMFNILRDARREMGEAQAGMSASSFVITSPDARAELDIKGMVGEGWWSDEWWLEAQTSGLMSIECHSWDHNHPSLAEVAQQDQVKGDFKSIASYADCDVQVTRAGDYIEHKLEGHRPSLFAYPWGQASDYLLQEFMPGFQTRHRFRAGFSCEPRAISQDDNIWFLPRWVCGRDWKSTSELLALVEQP